jgi:hypothetical protein
VPFDAGYAELKDLVDEEGERGFDEPMRNEAQTRFDLIDRVIRDVLEWPTNKLNVEQRVGDGGYTDYELVDGGTLAIVEAKREDLGFALPLDLAAGTCSLKPLVDEGSNSKLKAAMHQVMRYAGLRGVAPCVVTNGHQWIAFLGSRNDGVAPLAGKALVYPSLRSIQDNFVTFFNTLSYDGIQAKRIFSELSVGLATPPAPLAATIHDYPGIKRRNVVQTNLEIMGQLMLEDMPQEERYSETFLRECYASSGALSSYAEISRELLISRNVSLLADLGAIEQPAALKKGVNPALSDEALAAAASHRPIVLLGGVGAGKSTFIQHLVMIDARSVFQDAISIMVDYGRGATFTSPTEYAIERIRTALLEEHDIDVEDFKFVEDLYRKELDRFDRGVFGQLKQIDPKEYQLKRLSHLQSLVDNRPEHLRQSISRIVKSRHRQVVIFLDNVDQRDHTDQNQVFLAANELAASWDATVFVTLRPETYYESQRYGAVSGYHPRVFTIAPPRTDVMLQKRVDFALRVLESGGDARTSSGVGFGSESLELFLRVLEQNFSRNRVLMALIDNLAGGNMRRALDFVTDFIGSGHVDTEKIIGIERRDPGEYQIPLHEFLRSLLHGDCEYYDPQTSPIANLFTVDRAERRNHFLLPLTLDYILSRGDAKDNSGYVEVADVYQHFQGLGFSLDAITVALGYLGRFKLAEAPLDDFDPTRSTRARITTVGAYTLRNLPSQFTYIDAIVVDTPIIDHEVRGQVGLPRSMADRLTRVEVFRSYLDECWSASGLDSQGWSWPTVSSALQRDITHVSARSAVAQPRR